MKLIAIVLIIVGGYHLGAGAFDYAVEEGEKRHTYIERAIAGAH